MLSKKYLVLLIFFIFMSTSVVCADEDVDLVGDVGGDVVCADEDVDLVGDVGGDVVCADENKELVKKIDEEKLSDSIFEDEEEDDFNYESLYKKAILKPVKLTTTYDSGITFKVKVVSAYYKSMTLDGVKIKLRTYYKNSYKDHYAYTNFNGIAEFKLSKLSIGTHKVRIYSADSFTSAKKVTSKIKIKKAKTTVSAPKITATYKKSKTFKIRIIDKYTKKAIKHVKISVKVGKKKFTLKTNYKGIASFKTKSFKAGKYKVTIKSKNSKYIINSKSSLLIKKVYKKKTKHHSHSSHSSTGSYIGNANTGKFHYSYCSAVKRMSSSNKVHLTYQQAINGGYISCKICNP